MMSPTEKICVPTPQSTQYIYRGFKNTTVPSTTPIGIRWTDDDRWYVTQQAHKLGITFSEFVRWVAYHAAVEVERIEHARSFGLSETAREKPPINLDEYE